MIFRLCAAWLLVGFSCGGIAAASDAPHKRAFAEDRFHVHIAKSDETLRIDSVCFESDTAFFRVLKTGEKYSLPLSEVESINRDASRELLKGLLSGLLISGVGVAGFCFAQEDLTPDDDPSSRMDRAILCIGAIPVGMLIGGAFGSWAGYQTLYDQAGPSLGSAERETRACSKLAPTVKSGAESLQPQVQRKYEAKVSASLPLSRHRLALLSGSGSENSGSTYYGEPFRFDYHRTLYTQGRSSAQAGLGYASTRILEGEDDPDPRRRNALVLSLGALFHGRHGRGFSWNLRVDYFLGDSEVWSSGTSYAFGVGYRFGLHPQLLLELFARSPGPGMDFLGLRGGFAWGW